MDLRDLLELRVLRELRGLRDLRVPWDLIDLMDLLDQRGDLYYFSLVRLLHKLSLEWIISLDATQLRNMVMETRS